MYLQGVLPWNSAKWVAPPPEEIARIRKEAGTHDAPHVDDGIAPPPEQGGRAMSDSTDVEKDAEHEPKDPIQRE